MISSFLLNLSSLTNRKEVLKSNFYGSQDESHDEKCDSDALDTIEPCTNVHQNNDEHFIYQYAEVNDYIGLCFTLH